MTTSKEDYLERIYDLIESKGYARVSDIAGELSLSRPSVSIMIQHLSEEGYLNYEKYRGITMTSTGKKIAQDIRNRHLLLSELFLLLGISKKTVEKDVEGIEHHISNESLKKFAQLIKHLKKYPLDS